VDVEVSVLIDAINATKKDLDDKFKQHDSTIQRIYNKEITLYDEELSKRMGR
jgi:hypothetical protein